jgi:hypothetical protein
MSWESRRARLAASIAAGVALGVVYTASPLTFLVVAAFPLVLRRATRQLSAADTQAVTAILTAAFAARVLLIAAIFVIGIPAHNDLSVGALAGDERYNVSRALRMRDVLLGMATSKYDYMVAFDEYGASSYLVLLTAIQTLFGPAPFGIKVFNSVLFIVGAVLLYRTVRPAYGAVPAMLGLGLLLFIPSLLYSSASALKESAYFLAAATCVTGAIYTVRASSISRRVLAIAFIAASVWILNDLRRGGAELAIAGLAVGFAARLIFVSKLRTVAAGVVAGGAMIAVLVVPSLRGRLIDGLTAAAKMHSGHVFTVGHKYELLDAGSYYTPAAPSSFPLVLSPDHAARFALRGVYTFLVTPLPWQMRSRGELAALPEQVLWYLLIIGVPIGIVAGWKRDRLTTALLVGYVLPTAAVLALTTGNVGTLMRLRGLVTPYVLWVSVLGYCVMLDWLVRSPRPDASNTPSEFGALTRATS